MPRLIETPLPGLLIIETDRVGDARGWFTEVWHHRDFASAGLDVTFVQENHSCSRRGVIRGLHYQDQTAPMAKLVRCVTGTVFDVAVDLRASSPTFGRWYGMFLVADVPWQLFVPVGFAHGVAALTDEAGIAYLQTAVYTPRAERTIAWNDPDIGVEWPIATPTLSPRDQGGQSFAAYRLAPVFP